MKDMGQVHYFLGVEVTQISTGLFLSQQRYTENILKKVDILDCKPSSTPMVVKLQYPEDSEPYPYVTQFRAIVGSSQCLLFTRPDLSYPVNSVCQHMHRPTQFHFSLVIQILRYLKATITWGQCIFSNSSLSLVAFSDSDWAGCPNTRKSTSGFCTYLSSNCIFGSSKKQSTMSRSSTEAECRSMASTADELAWLSHLFRDLGIPLVSTPQLFCDDMSALNLTINPDLHAKSKHIQINYHFVIERMALKLLQTKYIPAKEQIAAIFTKPLLLPIFQQLCYKLSLAPR